MPYVKCKKLKNTSAFRKIAVGTWQTAYDPSIYGTLNVRADNPPALSAYRALGYRVVTEFEERLIHRQTSLWDSIVGPVRALVSDLRRNG